MEDNNRRKYTKEFKLEAVRLLNTRGKSGHDLEKDLGIGSGLIYRWRRELDREGQRAFPGNGLPRDEELARLRKELAEAREDRDILRKALAFFSRTSR
jgi:transposase